MDAEKARYDVLQSQFHKRVRFLRAMILRGKKMRRMQPAEMRHLQSVITHGDAHLTNPNTLMQKHARLLRLSATRAKKMKLLNPVKESCSKLCPQTSHTKAIDKCGSKKGDCSEINTSSQEALAEGISQEVVIKSCIGLQDEEHRGIPLDCSEIDMSCEETWTEDVSHEVLKENCIGIEDEEHREIPIDCSEIDMSCEETWTEDVSHEVLKESCNGVKDGEHRGFLLDCTEIDISCQETLTEDISHEVIIENCIGIEDEEHREIPLDCSEINITCQETLTKDIPHEVNKESCVGVEEEEHRETPLECSEMDISCQEMLTGDISHKVIKESCIRVEDEKHRKFPLDCSEINTSCQKEVTKDICDEVMKESCVGVENEEDSEMEDAPESDREDESVTDIWKEMAFVMESCKETPENLFSDEHERGDDYECDHSFIMKDDIGSVCRVCGLVQKGVEDIFEFCYPKRIRTRSYRSESQNIEKYKPDETLPDWSNLPTMVLTTTEILGDEKHMKQMKPHQREGFNFLLRNLVTEDPHGCILAHAPGSGKTFMIICFMQSFLSKYPSARPLVVLPKGIIGTWKKEFQRWQVEDIPLYDLYSVKASTRSQQLAVLKQWVDQKSILFLGYKQFSSIVTGNATSKEMTACQEILVRAPTILILDEGHTPRNEGTDTLTALIRVQTPRKVVLSGTLYQNHVKEVFTILNLVQPRFLKLEANRVIVRRILSKVEIPGVRKQLRGQSAKNTAFYDLLESTLLNDENYQRKVGVVKDLREMTNQVLHYYKGDSFDELPGLVDFTILLNLSPKQRAEVDKSKDTKEKKFKSSSIGSATYIHPQLKQFSVSSDENKQANGFVSDEKLDQIIEKINLKDGVKAKFFLNLLRLCETSQEKLLVFSHYLLPLRFLERLAVHYKGWTQTKEIFMITGESTPESREWSMERFNNSPDSRVFFGSVKACGEGISLVGASRILMLDVHPNPSVSWQAICRAFRPGQKKKVYTYRLVAADSPEEEDHMTCFRKELIAKMWFEWDEFSRQKGFDCQAVGLEDCGDTLLQSPILANDVKALYRRNSFSGK